MNILFSNSIGYRFASQAYFFAFLIGLVITTGFVWLDYEYSQDRFLDNTRALLSSGSHTSSVAVYHLNMDLSQVIVEDLTEYPAIMFALIVDHNGKTIARAQRSAVLSRYRWISDAFLGKNTRLQQPLYSPPPNEEFLGYLIIEVDTFIIGRGFLQRAGIIMMGGITLTILLSSLLIWLNRRQLIQPIQNMLENLTDINPHQPGELRVHYPVEHHLDEIGALIEHTNKLINSVDTNIQRRDRAENDLRKNLGSIEHIVSERTEILRNQNNKLQASLTNTQLALEQQQQQKQKHPALTRQPQSLELKPFLLDVLAALKSSTPFPIPEIAIELDETLANSQQLDPTHLRQLLHGLCFVAAEICDLAAPGAQITLTVTPIKDALQFHFIFDNLQLDPDTFESLLERPDNTQSDEPWHQSWAIIDGAQATWQVHSASTDPNIPPSFQVTVQL